MAKLTLLDYQLPKNYTHQGKFGDSRLQKNNIELMRQNGSVTLEMGFAIIALVTLSLWMVNIVNVMRARSAVREAAFDTAGKIARLGSTLDLTGNNVAQVTNAITAGKAELKAIFPAIRFNCTDLTIPHCGQLKLREDLTPNSTAVTIIASYNIPTYLGFGVVPTSATETRSLESLNVPTELAVIDQTFFNGTP